MLDWKRLVTANRVLIVYVGLNLPCFLNPFHAVLRLLDLVMPEMDGIATAGGLKRIMPDVPFCSNLEQYMSHHDAYQSPRGLLRESFLSLASTKESPRPEQCPHLGETAMGHPLPVGSSVDFHDSRRDLSRVQRKHSMSNSNGIDPDSSPAASSDRPELVHDGESASRKSQLRRGPCAVWPRFVCSAKIHTPENDGNSLVARIRADQQAVFDLLRSVESGPERPSLKKAKEVGR